MVAPPQNLLGGRRCPSEQLEAFFLTKAMVLAILVVPLLVHEVKYNIKIFFIITLLPELVAKQSS